MSGNEDADGFNATELAAQIVAAFISHNSLPVAELPGLIGSVDAALRGLAGQVSAAAESEKLRTGGGLSRNLSRPTISFAWTTESSSNR